MSENVNRVIIIDKGRNNSIDRHSYPLPEILKNEQT